MTSKEHSDFMLEEYRNIASTHDKLREIIVRMFNYFLILAALPFTVAGIIYKNEPFDLLSPPPVIHLLFLIIGIASFMLALSMLDARLGQYRYAKTVNLIRKYFLEKSSDIKDYLYLPYSDEIPKWTRLGFIGWQIYFIILLGGVFTSYGIYLFRKILFSIGIFILYWIFFFIAKKKVITNYSEKHDLT